MFCFRKGCALLILYKNSLFHKLRLALVSSNLFFPLRHNLFIQVSQFQMNSNWDHGTHHMMVLEFGFHYLDAYSVAGNWRNMCSNKAIISRGAHLGVAEIVHLGATEAQRDLTKGFTAGRMLSTWGSNWFLSKITRHEEEKEENKFKCLCLSKGPLNELPKHQTARKNDSCFQSSCSHLWVGLLSPEGFVLCSVSIFLPSSFSLLTCL